MSVVTDLFKSSPTPAAPPQPKLAAPTPQPRQRSETSAAERARLAARRRNQQLTDLPSLILTGKSLGKTKPAEAISSIGTPLTTATLG